MNRQVISLFALALLLNAVVASANTRVGNANTRSIQSWSFTPTGPVDIVLSWTNGRADLDMILVCGFGSDPFVYGVDLGIVDRLATIQVDPFGVPCVLGVTSFRNASAYRVHFRQGANLVSRAAGREPRPSASDDSDERQGADHPSEPSKPLPFPDNTDNLIFKVERTIWNLHQEKTLMLQ